MKRYLWLTLTMFIPLTLLAQAPQQAAQQPGQQSGPQSGQQSGPQSGPGGPPPDGQKGKWEGRGPGMRGERMPMGMMGMWWKNPETVQKIGLTDDQTQRIDKTFQEFRLQLIDLHASLEKQETLLQPLVDADQPDEGKVMAQVDKVTQARAALERANAQMMLAIRRVLTPDQWKKLQESTPGRRHGFGEGRPDGPPQRPGGDD